jgi:lysophospholipase L1-like esterase
MTRRTGYALLAAFVALMTAVSAAIYVGVGQTTSPRTRGAGTPPLSRSTAAPAAAGTWTGTWATSPVSGEPDTSHGYPGMTIRNVVHTTVGGSSARVHLSNLYGTEPLLVTRATVAVAAGDGGADAAAGTLRTLTFGGRRSVTIPAGGSVVSDPAPLDVPALSDLLVSTYSPTASGPVTYHPYAREISFVARGEHTAAADATAFTGRSPFWRYVTGVDVWTSKSTGAVVALGDSITDGSTSTVGANHRWPDYLAVRLGGRTGVLNEGISGNRVLLDGGPGAANPSALSRLERDVLSRADARTVVVMLGINDILRSPAQTDPTAITDGLRDIVRRAHARGLRVIGGTLLPFEGHHGYNARTEAVRQGVNAVIRHGGVYDAVVDFDKALRDPYRPTRMRPDYDSGDHLHPGDAGYRAMAYAVDLRVLRERAKERT